MKFIPFIFLSILGGLIIPLQLAMVNAFRQSTQASQIQATFYLYLGGTVMSFVMSLLMSGGIRPPQSQNAQWWHWLTGFLGSFYILLMFVSAPKIGSANTLLWVFLGQMIFATLLSAFGLLGLEIQKPTLLKIVGLFLVMVGGFLMIYSETKHKF